MGRRTLFLLWAWLSTTSAEAAQCYSAGDGYSFLGVNPTDRRIWIREDGCTRAGMRFVRLLFYSPSDGHLSEVDASADWGYSEEPSLQTMLETIIQSDSSVAAVPDPKELELERIPAPAGTAKGDRWIGARLKRHERVLWTCTLSSPVDGLSMRLVSLGPNAPPRLVAGILETKGGSDVSGFQSDNRLILLDEGQLKGDAQTVPCDPREGLGREAPAQLRASLADGLYATARAAVAEDTEQAMRALEQSVALRPSEMRSRLRADKGFDALRKLRRFRKLVEAKP